MPRAAHESRAAGAAGAAHTRSTAALDPLDTPPGRDWPQAGNGTAGALNDDSPPVVSVPVIPATPARRTLLHALKNWRVRSRLLLLVLLPTLAAVILGGISVASSVRSAFAYQRVEQFSRLGGAITDLAQAIQNERQDTIKYITMGSSAGGRGAPAAVSAPERAVLTQDYRVTDQLATRLRTLAATIDGSYPALAQQESREATAAINGLPALRSVATGTQIPSLVVIQEYANTIEHLLALEGEIATGSNDAALADTVRLAGLISSMKEEVTQEQAILTSALTPDLVGATQFQPGQLSAINAAQAQQQADLAQFNLTASGSQRQLYNNALSSAQADRAQAQIQQAINLALAGGSSAENPAFTNAANGSAYLVASLRKVERGFMSSIIGQSGSLRAQAITSASIGGIAVILVLALAFFFTMAVGRSMTRPLARLRTGALEVAGVRLPETVRRMSQGSGDAPLEVDPIDVDSTDEIGEVARAFDQVHREAVRLAANEAALRGNINAMFVNLSRRSQSLVERQIRLIDDLEQGEQDAERLSNLFRMDHLATRMRRNSENLLVLAGQDLSRRWSEPVALVDVLRAAVSEIEHYERVKPNIQAGIAVRGHAVSDVVHLLSELAENATAFSPADTMVNVSGYLLNSGGALVDLTDQGVGMDSEEVAEANWRLDHPPVVDVAVSRRMGLFVVARLAARHGIRVRLQPAAMGGLTALVWLPDEIITRSTVTTRWIGTGPPNGEVGEPSAAARAVAAARGRFSEMPHREALAEAAVDPGAVLAAPSADVTESAPVAGPAAAGSAPASSPVVPVSTAADVAEAASPADAGPEERLPIFESVESDWFRRGKHSVDHSPARGSWSSPADAGWRAAEVADAPVAAGHTSAGLPRRQPGANLVPGGIGQSPLAPPPPARTPAQTRDRMSSFQQGIRRARANGPGDESYPASVADGDS